MSNKRNRRRKHQRVRSEVNRKPRKLTRSMAAFIETQPAERKRKAEDASTRSIYFPTRKDVKRRSRVRLKLRGHNWRRKPRTKYGRTYWNHSHDV